MPNLMPFGLDPDPLVELLRRHHELDVSAYDDAFLRQTFDRRRAEMGPMDASAYSDLLSESRPEAGAFCRALSVEYSTFFRDPLSFAVLERSVLPALSLAAQQSGQREIRVWSAGCAGGQEAWSVAMLLADSYRNHDRRPGFRIIATDVCGDALLVAQRALYPPATLQNLRFRHLQDYLVTAGDEHAIVPWLRQHVDFSVYDLLDEHSSCPPTSLYGDFDLILCCKLLFYYRTDVQLRIVEKLQRALAPWGYLMTGDVERTCVAGHRALRPCAPQIDIFQKC